jgi:hypothetical protein
MERLPTVKTGVEILEGKVAETEAPQRSFEIARRAM